eukprot:CAMPEP_0173384440 /NCGR_PEP_ID=MMETSP1356-20130122/7010_1 /TAXON_ID=77927 ORGANISM="Hemiselmis virescens, Strain PCC157" /NCGR_SAMPLE_ID=MMETSP1356 /ASSEMBLY_ACC=CAM_ASM_000847 /LENGTH=55 /DNA_ID=CAMNT_0014339785 /DNA_START=742 /DNA_END=909 /DNA_ORIENTATION=+
MSAKEKIPLHLNVDSTLKLSAGENLQAPAVPSAAHFRYSWCCLPSSRQLYWGWLD